MTIQAALVGGVEAKRVRKRLIALRLKEQDALRRRFDRAKWAGDLPDTVEAADLARFITCCISRYDCAGYQRRES